ncbi:helix-turn-helix transcriptional regulator [Cupriavidus basilensis]|uniref:Helix-turn-helix transcriptional regulator n=1 Tax=Cupriavidus basilensis TaxID=68895 RepID=A0ABT6ARE5_9BURK|nr:helix-turn-helix transcriptional regulator [Cupriavidus basilensis]MDF3835200.1 helix-turn-helix transcriptional regulator [Cupriavidus basilensis]
MKANANLLLETISALYEGVTDPQGFSAALAKFSSLTGSPNSIFILWPDGAPGGTIEDSHSSESMEAVSRYNSSYNALDPTRDIIPHLPNGAWYYDQRDLPRGFIARSEFYQDFFYPGNLGCMVATRASTTPYGAGFFGQQRLKDQSFYDSADLALLAQISPHLTTAATLRFELDGLRTRLSWLEEAFNQLQSSMILCDAAGKVLFANSPAEGILRDPTHPFRVQVGYLTSAKNNDALQKAIRQAAGRLMAASAVAVALGSDESRQFAWVVPVPPNRMLAMPWQIPMAMVWIRAADTGVNPGYELLRSVYGLTAAEYRLAELLGQDLTPAECAESLAISVTTVRTQIRAIYNKLGCSRQSTFLKILGSLHSPG